MKGITSQVMGVGWEVQPTLAVEDPRAPEMAWLRSDRLQHAAVTVTPVAGQYGYAQLMNLSTNHLAVIEQILMTCASSTRFELAAYDTAFANAIEPAVNRDRRQDYVISTAGTTLIVPDKTNTASALGTPFAYMRAVGQSTAIYTAPIVLAPNTGVVFRPGAVNLGFEGAFVWRERPAEPGELDFS